MSRWILTLILVIAAAGGTYYATTSGLIGGDGARIEAPGALAEGLEGEQSIAGAKKADGKSVPVDKVPADNRFADITIPYEEFTLGNGLRVIVHEDRKAPLVSVHVWYHVGSKDEPEGKTGFAHLFEHLMFNGSENYDDEWFGPLQEAGGSNLNGTTWFDRTNYYQTVPTPALERVLWMESDRMGHLLGAVTQEKLDNQRGVVQNEKRQGDNQPYGLVGYRQLEGVFPPGHPYRHSTIGSMEDLEAASLEDVHEWFEQYYGPNNAILVLAGDINAQEARPLVEAYFADIEPGPALTKLKAWTPEKDVNVRETMQDDVPQARIYRSWATPTFKDIETGEALDMAGAILGDGKNSRLYKALVYDQQIATGIAAYNQEFEVTNWFQIEVTLQDGVAVEDAHRALDAVLAEFIEKGPTEREVERVKTSMLASLAKSNETVHGKANVLAYNTIYTGDPNFFRKRLAYADTLTPAKIQRAAQRWLTKGYHQIDVIPFPDLAAAETAGADRSALPGTGEAKDVSFPEVEAFALSNGVPVYLARRDTVPAVRVTLQFDAGYAADAASGAKLGAASFTSAMLDEGAGGRSALEIAEEAEFLGASVWSGAGVDYSTVGLSALKLNLDPSLKLMADIALRPDFPQDEIDRLKPRWLASIAQEKVDPVSIAYRLLPPMLYGEGHPYALPLTGSGDEASITALTQDDLIAHHQTWYRPSLAVLFVAGDTTREEIEPLLEKHFGGWGEPQVAPPAKSDIAAAGAAEERIIIVDRPGSPQSLILGGRIAPALDYEEQLLANLANDILGGEFTARVNMNLREEKGWAYGAYTFSFDARGEGMWLAYAPVQTDKTSESLAELRREIASYLGARPASSEEIGQFVTQRVRELPGTYETSGSVLSSIVNSKNQGRPFDFPATLASWYAGLEEGDVRAAAPAMIGLEDMTWLVIGDRAEIEEALEGLEIGPVLAMTADGDMAD